MIYKIFHSVGPIATQWEAAVPDSEWDNHIIIRDLFSIGIVHFNFKLLHNKANGGPSFIYGNTWWIGDEPFERFRKSIRRHNPHFSDRHITDIWCINYLEAVWKQYQKAKINNEQS